MLIKSVRIDFLSIERSSIIDFLDDFCAEIIREGNTKVIVDLVLNGYTDIVDQAKTSEDLSEEMTTFINEEIPRLMVSLFVFFLREIPQNFSRFSRTNWNN